MFRKLLLPVAFSFIASLVFAQDDQNKFDASRYWAVGIQMWTFNTSTFYTALKRPTAAISNISKHIPDRF